MKNHQTFILAFFIFILFIIILIWIMPDSKVKVTQSFFKEIILPMLQILLEILKIKKS
jgi:hypothetical protein